MTDWKPTRYEYAWDANGTERVKATDGSMVLYDDASAEVGRLAADLDAIGRESVRAVEKGERWEEARKRVGKELIEAWQTCPSHLDRFEAVASLFYGRFGRLAPGKSDVFCDSNDPENCATFAAWSNSSLALYDAAMRIARLEAREKELVDEREELEARLKLAEREAGMDRAKIIESQETVLSETRGRLEESRFMLERLLVQKWSRVTGHDPS